MIKDFILDEEIFFKDWELPNQNSLFEKIGNILIEKNYVDNQYIEAIKEREKEYPTGIYTPAYPVAIPHVDAKYAKVNTIFIVTSKYGIEFEDAEEDRNLKAKIIFGIIIKDHDSHIDFLVQVSNLIQNESLLNDIYNAKNPKEIKEIIKNYLSI
ncbi:PTS sugar transporter subunit IIA [Brachyspira pilosicoli]|uniref:PTS sugar transporter subunit IIA n=1 Tax=Brachyspira pilosicoli TaxID=52584 RepID=UPI003006BAAC